MTPIAACDFWPFATNCHQPGVNGCVRYLESSGLLGCLAWSSGTVLSLPESTPLRSCVVLQLAQKGESWTRDLTSQLLWWFGSLLQEYRWWCCLCLPVKLEIKSPLCPLRYPLIRALSSLQMKAYLLCFLSCWEDSSAYPPSEGENVHLKGSRWLLERCEEVLCVVGLWGPWGQEICRSTLGLQGSFLCDEVVINIRHRWKHANPHGSQFARVASAVFSRCTAVVRLGALLLRPRCTMLPWEIVAVWCFGFEVGFQLPSMLSVGLSHFYR